MSTLRAQNISNLSDDSVVDTTSIQIVSEAYNGLGVYVAGLTVNTYQDSFTRDGIKYRAALTTSLPYTTTGTWATDEPFFKTVGDSELRDQLASPSGGTNLVYGSYRTISTIASLKTTAGKFDKEQVSVLGYHSTHPGIGGGVFYWDAASTATDDTGLVFQVTGVPTGRWKRIFDKLEVNVAWYGAKGDGVADDWAPIQQAMRQELPIRLFGHHLISQPLDFGTNTGTKAVLSGHNTQKSFDCILETMPNFNGFAMLRNWATEWYAVGESQALPPANMVPYSSLFSRYCNVRGIRFRVNGTQANRIHAIDFIAQHEGSTIEDCFFIGNTPLKGACIRCLQPASGTEVANNVWRIERCTAYDSWQRMLDIINSGSDVMVRDFVTTKEVCDESPVRIHVNNVKFSNFHIEAFATGKSTIECRARGFSWMQGHISIRNLQGDVLDIDPPSGASTNFVHPDVQDINIYPEGGSWANVTNASSINLVNDAMVAGDVRIVPLVGHLNMTNPAYLVRYTFDSLTLTDSNGRQVTKDMSGMWVVKNATWNSANALDIPYSVADGTGNHSCQVIVQGRNAATNAPFHYRGWIGVSSTNSRAVGNLDAASGVVGTIGFTFNAGTGRYTLTTTDATGMAGCNIRIQSPGRWQSMVL